MRTIESPVPNSGSDDGRARSYDGCSRSLATTTLKQGER